MLLGSEPYRAHDSDLCVLDGVEFFAIKTCVLNHARKGIASRKYAK